MYKLGGVQGGWGPPKIVGSIFVIFYLISPQIKGQKNEEEAATFKL